MSRGGAAGAPPEKEGGAAPPGSGGPLASTLPKRGVKDVLSGSSFSLQIQFNEFNLYN
jgi:hypothetical protein